METPVYLRRARPLPHLAHRFGNGSSLVSFSKWLYCDIADEYRAVLISCPSRIRNQTILFCLSPTNWDRFVDDARCLYERSFLGFCLFDVKGRKTHYDAKLTPWFARSLNVHLCGICRLSFTTSSGYWSWYEIYLWRDLHPQACHCLRRPFIRYFTGFGEHGNSLDI